MEVVSVQQKNSHDCTASNSSEHDIGQIYPVHRQTLSKFILWGQFHEWHLMEAGYNLIDP